MPTQKRVNMDHAFVIDVFILRRGRDALRGKLLNCVTQPTQAIATVSKRDLGQDNEPQNHDQDLAFHIGEAPTSVGGSRASCSPFLRATKTGQDAGELVFEI